VFEVASVAQQAAKIYHEPLSRERAQKIRVMAGLLRDHPIMRLTAWPIDLLSKRSGQPIGLLLPKVPGVDVHRLYSPKSRQTDFQQADWKFLIRAAANTARAFAAVHDAGCVIGDVNHGSILVAQNATVRLIDCDSFQFSNGVQRFLCDKGVETFTPPELQDRSFTGVVRTQNHDNFGLAVMIFLMLFMGRHPFAGRFFRQGEMPISRAIKESRFAYGVRRSDAHMERPPGSPPLFVVGDEVGMLFELAFSREMLRDGRPSASEWSSALQQLEQQLTKCKTSGSHLYHQSSASCPWCQMEAATGLILFPISIPDTQGVGFDITPLWRDVEALRHPGPAPTITDIVVQPSEQAKQVRAADVSKNWVAGIVGMVMILVALSGQLKGFGAVLFFGGIAAFFIVRTLLDRSDQVRHFRPVFEEASRRWDAAKADWLRRAGPKEFDDKKAALEALRRRWSDIPNLRHRKLDQLNRERRERQLSRFLDRYKIEEGRIAGIGPGRTQTLESYGIETAADIQKLTSISVPGFGPVLRSNLFEWRDTLAQRFRFDPRKADDPQDIARIEREVLVEKKQLEDKLRAGVNELRQIQQQITVFRQHSRAQLEGLQREYAQAAANYNAARGM
jgi:DNA-binding helix-hairpin-helix protein with protein kinase domain